jgi:hypothetical protein
LSYALFKWASIPILPHILDKTLSYTEIHTFFSNMAGKYSNNSMS